MSTKHEQARNSSVIGDPGIAALPPSAHAAPHERNVTGQHARVQHNHIARQQLPGVHSGDASIVQHLHLAGVVRQGGQAAAVLVCASNVGDDGEERDAHDDQAVAVVRLGTPGQSKRRTRFEWYAVIMLRFSPGPWASEACSTRTDSKVLLALLDHTNQHQQHRRHCSLTKWQLKHTGR
jgi:hypothetical protein